MDILKELTGLVTKNKLKSIELLDTTKQPKSKLTQLYEAISDDQVMDDEQATALFYPGKENTALYRKLKAKLRRRLINALLLIDVKKASYSDRKSAYYECYKKWAVVRILMAKNAWNACVEIAERILRYAIKFEFTELTLDLLGVLRLHYGTRVGNLKKFEEYKKLYFQYEAIFLAENRAEILYTELVVHYVNQKATQIELREQAEQALQDISHSLKEYDSYRLHLYGSIIRLMVTSIINDHAATINTCDEIIAFFEKKPYRAETPLQAAYYQKLISHCQLKDFKAGGEAAKSCISLIEEGTVNWFKYYEIYFILAMHTRDYTEAAEVFTRATSHKRFVSLPENVQEVWLIYEAYLHFLYLHGLLESNQESDAAFSDDSFRLGRFLNQVVIYAKDKAGMNIAILVFQLIYYISQKKTDQLVDRMEAMEKYAYRYLKQENTLRSYYFIKMLLLLAKASLERKSDHWDKIDAYLEKLSAIKPEDNLQMYQIEIMPYEHIWSIVVRQMPLSSLILSR